MEDNFKSLLLSNPDPRDVIRRCMPDFVKNLDLEPVLDHVIAEGVLAEDTIDEYEDKKDKVNNQRQPLNRWFLRRIVLKESNEVIV